MKFLTKEEVANKLKMPVKWVEEAASSGRIPAPVLLDNHMRWREKEIDEWIEEGCPEISKSVRMQKDCEIHDVILKLSEVEKQAIMHALRVAKGNREKAARLLGIGERTLYRKIKEYELG